MTPRRLLVLGAAILAGWIAGLSAHRIEERVARVDEAIAAQRTRPGTAESGEHAHSNLEGGTGSPGSLSPYEEKAVAGLYALRAGDYSAAIPYLDAASEGIEAAELTAFRAAAREGAGRTREAEDLLDTDTKLEALRAIARAAFLQRQDFFISGPAYQLYLRLRPDAPRAAMMRQAIAEWKKLEETGKR